MKASTKKSVAHWLGLGGLTGTFAVTLLAAPAAVFAPIAMAGSFAFLANWWGADVKHLADAEESEKANETQAAILRELGQVRQAIDALVMMVSAIFAASLLRVLFYFLHATFKIVASGWFWAGALPVALFFAIIIVSSGHKKPDDAGQQGASADAHTSRR